MKHGVAALLFIKYGSVEHGLRFQSDTLHAHIAVVDVVDPN